MSLRSMGFADPRPVIDLVVTGQPLPKERPRFRGGQGGFTSAKTREAERVVRVAFEAGYPGWEPLSGRLAVEATFYRRTGHHVDADNLLKLVTDALNGVAWADDEQIEAALTKRVYGAGDAARTRLRVWAR